MSQEEKHNLASKKLFLMAAKLKASAFEKAGQLPEWGREHWHNFTHYNTLGYHASDVYWNIRGEISNVVDGYNSIDVISAGDRLLIRIADMLDYSLSLSYTDLDEEQTQWLDGAKKAAACLRGHSALYDELDMLFLADGFHDRDANGKKIPTPLLSEIQAEARKNFLDSWQWIGEHVFSDEFVVPDALRDAHVIAKNDKKKYGPGTMLSPVPDRKSIHLSFMADQKGKQIAFSAKRKIGRAFSPLKFSIEDVAAMPYGELIRLCCILETFTARSYGVPVDYADEAKGFYVRDDHWAEETSLAASFYGNAEVVEQEINYRTPSGSTGIRKNKDHPDYAAWIEDIVGVREAISRYVDWKINGGMCSALEASDIAEDRMDALDAVVTSEFMRAWTWLGEHIETLWI